eukprot:jgi/Mesvir1/10035/Mv25757-RA.1
MEVIDRHSMHTFQILPRFEARRGRQGRSRVLLQPQPDGLPRLVGLRHQDQR